LVNASLASSKLEIVLVFHSENQKNFSTTYYLLNFAHSTKMEKHVLQSMQDKNELVAPKYFR